MVSDSATAPVRGSLSAARDDRLVRKMRCGCIVAWHDVRIYFPACVYICAFAYVYMFLRTLMPPLQNVPVEFQCRFLFIFVLKLRD